MRALVSRSIGKVQDLEVTEVSLSDVGKDEVLIDVVACGLNFPDLLILEDKYQFKPEPPYSPGGEVTGIVSKIGEDVKDFYPGQRVFAIERWGGLAEKMVLRQERLQHLPDDMDLLSGASLLYNMSTALYALKNIGKALEGESILILGAGGGVGLATIQLAKAMGLVVIAASGKQEPCSSFGADFVINYTNLKNEVMRITQNQGVNLVLDTVGGEYAEVALRSLAFGGRYLVVGFASGVIPKFPLNLILLKGAEVKGVFWGKFSREEVGKQNENLDEIFEYYRLGKIKSYVGKTYSLDDSKEAILDFKGQKINGKAVVICSERLLESDNMRLQS